MDRESELKETICLVGNRLWNRDLIGANEGNISVRLGPEHLLCTRHGVCKGFLKMDDIVTITLLGSSLDNRVPSSEIALHLRAYQRRPDCNAIIHAHPLTATSMSLSGQKIPENALPEAGYVLGPVAYLDFAYPGTAEVPDSIERTIETHKTFLLSHHGAMTLGRDLWDACDRMETLERVAIMVREALSFGPIIGMPEMAHNRLKQEGLHGRLDS